MSVVVYDTEIIKAIPLKPGDMLNKCFAANVKQEGKWYIASCLPLDVHSQGHDEGEALRNLAEAIKLFVESCYERGTLDQVLKDCGFTP